jgi:hypothetical protein
MEEAEAFDAEQRLRPVAPPPVGPAARGDGIYSYGTTAGVRFRFVFRQSDGSLSSRRGFTSRRAAAVARRRLVESIDRGEVRVARESFATFWARLLRERRPYLAAGSFVDFETHGRKRLLPVFADVPLARMDEDRVRLWLAAMAPASRDRRHLSKDRQQRPHVPLGRPQRSLPPRADPP